MYTFPVKLEADGYKISVVVAQFSSEQTIEALLESIYIGAREIRQQASAIILRPDVRDQFDQPSLDAACEGNITRSSAFLSAVAEAFEDPRTHFGRFENLPVHILHSVECQPTLSANINPLSPQQNHFADGAIFPDIINMIRDAEMRFLIDHSRAFLPPIEGSYYLAPSNKPARSFLRVGNVQYSRNSIDAVTFWLLPHLKDTKAIIADTWSLSSIAMNASRVLAHMRGERPIPVEMLSQYQDASQDRQAALIEILDRLVFEAAQSVEPSESTSPESDEAIPISCLMSATQSGSLLDVLRDQIELSGLDIELTFVALFALGKTGDLPVLCDMSDDTDFKKIEDEEIAEYAAITVDPQVYFPLRYIDVELMPKVANAAPFRPFLDTVAGKGILSVHRDQASDGSTRHHGIHVDTDRLFGLPEFATQFEAKLVALDPVPELILCPMHPVAGNLAEMAADVLQETNGSRPKIVKHTSLELRKDGATAEYDAEVEGILGEVGEESAILILDDCYITGARLTGYQTRLRQLSAQARLHFLVGLARPENSERWDNFKRLVSFRAAQDRHCHQDNTVDSVFNVCLPNWQEEACPWCREATFYENLIIEGEGDDVPDCIANRQMTLADRDTGLRDDLFLVLDGAAPLKLHSGSIFTAENESCNQAEIFAAVAAALQNLRVARADCPPLGPRRYPIATMIRSSDYLHETYTDSILRAAILRGANAEELVYTDSEAEARRSRYISAIMTSTELDVNDLRAEILIAFALHKCTVAEDLNREALGGEAKEFLAAVMAALTK